MKTKLYLVAIFIATTLNAQVGIGVTNPTDMLEVDGSVVITDKFYVDGLANYNGPVDGFHLVAINPRGTNDIDGNVLEFYGNQEIMPIIIQPYDVRNVYRDDLNNLNLNISTDKYVISVANFSAEPFSTNSNEENLGLYKTGGNNSSTSDRTYGNFRIETFEEGGTWRVRIGSPIANTRYTTGRYNYKFDVILFPKRFFKNLGNVQYNLNGANSGTAASIPNL